MHTPSVDYRLLPGGSVQGTIHVPGDKSISHRAVMLAAVARGVSHISGLLEGEDVLRTVAAFRRLGVEMAGPAQGRLTVTGAGRRGLRDPGAPIDLGNSGTAMRLLTGLLAGCGVSAELVGDASLTRRPMRRIAEPLRQMGAQVRTSEDGTPPVVVDGHVPLRGIDIELPVASAQVKSAILLAGLGAAGRTCVTEPAPTRDHTERMLQGFGVSCLRSGRTVCVEGGAELTATDIEVPGDLSSAAFFIVAAALRGEQVVHLPGVGVNPTRTGVLDIAAAMGADVRQQNRRMVCGEPVADLAVARSSLRGIEIDPALVPLAIDEFPVLCIAAAAAAGTTIIRGAEELRHKESDRIAVMALGLRGLGVQVEELSDGMIIHGGRIEGGAVDSHGDHRVAMAFCIAALAATGPVVVRDCANVATSFPGFRQTAAHAGIRFDE